MNRVFGYYFIFYGCMCQCTILNNLLRAGFYNSHMMLCNSFFSLQVLKVQSELHDMKKTLTSIACTNYGGSNQKEGGWVVGGRGVFVTSLEKLRFVHLLALA